MTQPTEFLLKYGYVTVFSVVLSEQLGLPVPAAPFLVAVVTSATQSQRAGFAVILVFLVAGLVGLWWVKEERAEVAPPKSPQAAR